MNRTFNTEQVAIMYGVHKETVRGWVRSGKIKAQRPFRGDTGFLFLDFDLYRFERENPNIKRVELTNEQKLKFLNANRIKCLKVINYLSTLLKEESLELNEIMNEMTKIIESK